MEGLIVLLVITLLNINICCMTYLFKNFIKFILKVIKLKTFESIMELS